MHIQAEKTNPSNKFKPLSKMHLFLTLIKTKGPEEQLFSAGNYENFLCIKLFSIVKMFSTLMKLHIF